ncbi:MAG: tetratricopeptide repeat protein [Caldilineaceae bacterium]
MAEPSSIEVLLERLQNVHSENEQAALIAEMAFEQMPPALALTARRCAVLRWFDRHLVHALLPDNAQVEAESALKRLTALPFIEQLPYGWGYHDQMRAGLLETLAPSLLQEAARLAAPAYQEHPLGLPARQEALYCLVAVGMNEEATELLDKLLIELVGQTAWQDVLTLFAAIREAETFPFALPFQRTALHYLAHGLARHEQGDLAGAIADYDQAIPDTANSSRAITAPAFATLYSLRGNARYAQGELDAAIADYDQAIALNPQYANAFIGRGNARGDQGSWTPPSPITTRPLRSIPKRPPPTTIGAMPAATRGAGRRHRRLRPGHCPQSPRCHRLQQSGPSPPRPGELDAAIADYDQAIALNPQDADAYYNRGNARRDQGELDAAIADYDQAIALNPEYKEAYGNRGPSPPRQGDLLNAIADYDHVIALDPKDPLAYNNRGSIHRDQGELDAAIADYDQAIALNPEYKEAYGNQPSPPPRELDAAIADYDQAIALNPQEATAYNNRGSARRDQGELDAAIADYDQAIALNPQDANAYYNRGLARRDQGDLDAAIADYDQAIALNPQYAAAYNNKASTLRRLKRWGEATETVQKSLVLNPAGWIAWYILADLARRQGDDVQWQEAIERARPLVDYDDLYNAACFESVSGNIEKALELLQKAIEKIPTDATWARQDPDLEWIRHDERFWEIVGREETGDAVEDDAA